MGFVYDTLNQRCEKPKDFWTFFQWQLLIASLIQPYALHKKPFWMSIKFMTLNLYWEQLITTLPWFWFSSILSKTRIINRKCNSVLLSTSCEIIEHLWHHRLHPLKTYKFKLSSPPSKNEFHSFRSTLCSMYDLINIINCIEKNKNLMILLIRCSKKKRRYLIPVHQIPWKIIVLLKMSYNWFHES